MGWSWWTASNPRPTDYKSAALPTELHQHICGRDASRYGKIRRIVAPYRACQRWKTGNKRKENVCPEFRCRPAGGDSRTRTGDSLLAKQMRSQLRYTPKLPRVHCAVTKREYWTLMSCPARATVPVLAPTLHNTTYTAGLSLHRSWLTSLSSVFSRIGPPYRFWRLHGETYLRHTRNVIES